MTSYWYSTRLWTAQVDVDDEDRVAWAAPYLRSFVGQPRGNIARWCSQRGWPLQVSPLPPPDPHEPYSARSIARDIQDPARDIGTKFEETKM